MERILIFYSCLQSYNERSIWVSLNQTLKVFKETIKEEDIETTYDHFFYLKETKMRLDENRTWKENHVVSGDHIIYV